MEYVVQVTLKWQGFGGNNNMVSGENDEYLVSMTEPCPLAGFTKTPKTTSDIEAAFKFNTLAAAEMTAVSVGGKVKETQ